MKKKITMLTVFLFFSIILLGCARTKVTSFKDAEYSGKTYKNIAVLSPLDDLETRSLIENTFAVNLVGNGVASRPSIEIIPPTRTPSKDEINAKIKEGGFDAILLVELISATRETSYTPGYATTVWGKRGAFTVASGGHQISKPRVKFKIGLMDTSSQQNVWVSSTHTVGNAYAGSKTVIDSMVTSTITKLREDGLISAPAPTPAPPPVKEGQEPKK